MTENQIKYLQEFEKYKDIILIAGKVYYHCSGEIKERWPQYKLISINLEDDTVRIENHKTGFAKTKSGHWARKNLTLTE